MAKAIPNKIIGLILCLSLTISALAFGLVTVADAATSLGDINVWIIGGQSNAEGYGQYDWDDFAFDERFEKGFPDVLYWGNQEIRTQDTNGFIPLTLGRGQKKNSVGAEVGIATAVSQMGGKHAIIKCAIGSTFLYPYTAAEVSKDKHGTWTSPSFVKSCLSNDYYAKNHSANVNKSLTISDAYKDNKNINQSIGKVAVGNMYDMMVNLTLKPAIKALKDAGYNPVVRGMWWMQGEAETNILWDSSSQAKTSYQNVLKCFIKDIRADLTSIVGTDCSKVPFILGRVTRNSLFDAPSYLDEIQSAQDAVAADTALANVDIVKASDYFDYLQHDEWHFTAITQKWLGESFVNKVILAQGQDVKTPYGTIPKAYANTAKYPFAVFDKDGNFKDAATVFEKNASSSGAVGALDTAKSVGDGAVILMRRDFKTARYDNLSQFKGSFIIDLGGHRLIQGDGERAMLFADAKPSGGTIHDSIFTVKNGELQTSTLPAITFSSWQGNNDNKPEGKTFRFTFENVVFSGKSSKLVIGTLDDGNIPIKSSLELNLKDCVFDVDGRKGVTLIDASDPENKHTVNAKIVGGRILADTATAFTVFKGDDVMKQTFSLAPSAKGYTVLTLPTAASKPTFELNSESQGKLSFTAGVKNSVRRTNADKMGKDYNTDTNDSYTDYKLESKLFGGVTVTYASDLTSSLKTKILVSKADTISAITLNGKDLSIPSLPTETKSGATYYVIDTTVAARSVSAGELKITAGTGASAESLTYRLGLADMAKSSLVGATAAQTKAIKNALSFKRAAMKYFGTSMSAISPINDLLESSYDSLNPPTFTQDAVQPSANNGLAGATFILGDEPIIRFYTKGVAASKFTFKIDSTALPKVTGRDNVGSFVDVRLTYAQLTSDVTYTVAGEDMQGSFNLRAYYDFVKTNYPTNTDLISVIERLQCYAQSASGQ